MQARLQYSSVKDPTGQKEGPQTGTRTEARRASRPRLDANEPAVGTLRRDPGGSADVSTSERTTATPASGGAVSS